ncbi:MAG TPA: YciI-like protein [Caulobacterales bacterium]|nr:YciI-like protein [Caulobacterales bacterium]
MKHFLLFYDFGPNVLEERTPHRAAHLAFLNLHAERGDLVLAGALAHPLDGGVMVFKAETAGDVERIAAADPYVAHGVAKSWRVREWTTVVGKDALTKVVLT